MSSESSGAPLHPPGTNKGPTEYLTLCSVSERPVDRACGRIWAGRADKFTPPTPDSDGSISGLTGEGAGALRSEI